MTQKSDTELESCYGRECLQCADVGCQLREAGLNVIAEKKETLSIANGTNHRIYLETLAHRDDLSEMASGRFSANADSDCGSDAVVYAELAKALVTGDASAFAEAPSEEAAMFAADALRRLFWMLESKPDTTMVLLRRVFLGESQADYARTKNITRQAVSKRSRGDISGIAELLGLRLPQSSTKEAQLLKLTPEEFGVYKVCYKDGCSVRSAAIQLGMSPAKVQRVKQILSVKLQKSETAKKAKQKKS